jgi:hypothetical protein
MDHKASHRLNGKHNPAKCIRVTMDASFFQFDDPFSNVRAEAVAAFGRSKKCQCSLNPNVGGREN